MYDENSELSEDQDILGPHKSAEDIKAEERALKEQQKQADRAKKLARKTNKEPKPVDKTLMIMLGLLGIIVVGVAVVLAVQFVGKPKDMAKDSGHYTDLEAVPEMSTEGIKGAVLEAFYTKDKSLAVKMKLSNGLDTKHYLRKIEVTLKNEAGELIASGASSAIEKDFYVPAMGYSTFTLYILKPQVKIPDDSLSTLTYEITTEGEVEDASVLPSVTVGSDTSSASQ